MRSLGELIQHIAEARINYCGRVNAVTAKPDFGSKSKADIVKAFQASFEVCDAGWAVITDANAGEMTGPGRGALCKLGTPIRNVIHDNEEYGYMSVYPALGHRAAIERYRSDAAAGALAPPRCRG